MPDFKEVLQGIKDMIKPLLIKDDSSEEDISNYAKIEKSLDSLQNEHDITLGVNANLRESIIHVVKNQGSSDQPVDGAEGSKPKSIEECIAEVQSKKEK